MSDERVIYKYPVRPFFDLSLPIGAEILCVQTQNDQPEMWVLLNSKNPTVLRRFVSYGTGHSIPPSNLRYISTFQIERQSLVFHVFEELAP